MAYLQAIFSVNRSHHNAVVKCEATNEVGTKIEKTTLNVHCKSIRFALLQFKTEYLNFSYRSMLRSANIY